MNVNFGLFPPLTKPAAWDKDGGTLGRRMTKTLAKKAALSQRALNDLAGWIAEQSSGPAAAE